MDFKVCAVCVLMQFYFIGTSAVKLNDLYSEATAIKAGFDFTLSCDGNAPLSWKLPEKLWYFSDEDHEYWKGTTIHITNVPPRDEKYRYGSKIVLQNVTYPHTGFIICFERDRPFKQDKVYLFVRDEEHFSVSTETAIVIYKNIGKNVQVPFRPTTPDVNCTILFGNFANIKRSSYYGFNVLVDKSETEIQVSCKLLKKGSHYSYLIRLEQPLAINLTKISNKVTHLGEELRLLCETKHKNEIKLEWRTPSGLRYEGNILLIKNVSASDQGVYICKIREKSGRQYLLGTRNIYVNIIGNLINLTEETEAHEIIVNINKTFVQWSINVDASAKLELCWFDNLNQEISRNSNKYIIENSRNETILKILNISIFDSGYYTLTASNTYESRSLVLFLNVVDKPSIYISFTGETERFLQCWIFANPQPTSFSWFIGSYQNNRLIANNQGTSAIKNGFQYTTYFIADKNYAHIRCSAKNSLGKVESIRTFRIKEVREGISISGLNSIIEFIEETNEVLVALHEQLFLSCNLLNDSPVQWFHNGTKLEEGFGIHFKSKEPRYYNKKEFLFIEYVTLNNSGTFSCENKNGMVKSKNLTLRVLEPLPPNITDTNLLKDIKVKLPAPMELKCKSSGFLKHSNIWYKDHRLLEPSTRIKILHQNQTINFTSTEVHDEGYYQCVVSNSYGNVSKGAYVSFINKSKLLNLWILTTIVISVVLTVASVLFIIRYIYIYKLRREVKNFGLVNFETGDLIHINPNLPISEQVESLPYHYKWEFPVQEVKFEEQIGSGAFGIVMKAEARRIVDGEDFTTVAVKMVKRNKGFSCIRAFVSELKIMAYLENRLNIVNLLGADTKNLNKGELFVIVEYCRYGNVRNYLLNHRETFINQVDLKTESINYSIRRNISKESNLAVEKKKYLFSSSLFSQYDINKPGTSSEVAGGSRNDNDGNAIAHSLCTEDLLVWAFQVARGMDFLASNHILHGDLAARNILLCDDNVVKICDFGLSRRVYTEKNYKKKSNSPLPLKWMAVESIRDGIFSVESDVWSFGVVLWEFFTLGQTPYPGIQDEQLLPKLEFGYRMERPKYAPQEIYQVMLECWRGKPFLRPSFRKLMDRISSFLEEEVKQRYFNLKRPKPRNITQKVESVAALNSVDFEDSSSSSMLTSKNDVELVPL